MSKISFVAPHKQAAEIGLKFLKDGCSAVDAMVASAAAITVLYPHMNSIGGDSFWLISKPGEPPIAIDACGDSGGDASEEFYINNNYVNNSVAFIPEKGPGACVTQAGTLAGWELARSIQSTRIGGSAVGLNDLLDPAIKLAKEGVVTTRSLSQAVKKSLNEIKLGEDYVDEFLHTFAPDCIPPKIGEKITNRSLGETFERLSEKGLRDFYEGSLASEIAHYFENQNSPIRLDDFVNFDAKEVKPISVNLSVGKIYNLPPPTQGIASLIILGIFDRIYRSDMSELQALHGLIEATKQAFYVRDKYITDPDWMMGQEVENYLRQDSLKLFAENINQQAMPWPRIAEPGDTVWMGCVDKDGVMVSFIQSIYWEFGSSVVVPNTGIVWNNRGLSFKLDSTHHNYLEPNKKPLHTLNPAYAELNNGSRMVYGAMGGEGQPQTQSAIFTRAIYQDVSLEDAISDGRWLLGRTWGEDTSDLKIERSLYQRVGKDLEERQHQIKEIADHQEIMGHAGAIKLDGAKDIEAATDPRSNGAALIG